MEFSHKKIEKKWQKFWEENSTFKTTNKSKKKKYILDMFPYPSGSGIHVGHPKGYVASDVYARFKKMQGYDILHPIGWDAFGLPAEQYALKTGKDPRDFTQKNIDNFKIQIKKLGISYDWNKEINTSHPNFYKITQWIFQQIYKKGLASIEMVKVNWCPNLGTVLSNEEVEVNEKGLMVSKDHGNQPVIKKFLKQWVLKITKYADRLLEDLNDIDWPDSLKELQKNWIGRSQGMVIDFPIFNSDEKIEIFTTRPDTIFGATYLVIAPEHKFVKALINNDYKKNVDEYVLNALKKTDIDRQDDSKEKTGVFTGSYAINPITKEKIKIYVGDYVLGDYALGAIMAVPAHDPRDWDFAKKYNLEIKFVLDCENINKAFVGDTKLINSEFLNGLEKNEAIKKISEYIIKNKFGFWKINYKLRDWVFSRQRFYGEPFPVYFDENDEIVLIDEENLPLMLPNLKEIKPSGTGESPLANSSEWVNIKINNKNYKRDTNTMPQWAGSSWYYLAYILVQKPNEFIDIQSDEAKELFKKWLPVDLYIGGQEHAVAHLIYARFWHKVLYDLNIVPTKEPFQKLINQGMVQDEKGMKMSKSKGNVINPDDIIDSHGADALRLYIMFMVPLEASVIWNYRTLDASRKWLDRVYRMFEIIGVSNKNDKTYDEIFNKTLKNFTQLIETYHFNTPISQLMTFVNEVYKNKKSIYIEYAKNFIKMLSLYAPHICEELWEICNQKGIVYDQKWPQWNESILEKKNAIIAIQINGKLKGTIETQIDCDEEVLESNAKNFINKKNLLNSKKIIKIIVVKNKIVNFVVK